MNDLQVNGGGGVLFNDVPTVDGSQTRARDTKTPDRYHKFTNVLRYLHTHTLIHPYHTRKHTYIHTDSLSSRLRIAWEVVRR